MKNNMMKILAVLLCMLMAGTQAMALDISSFSQENLTASLNSFSTNAAITERMNRSLTAESVSSSTMDTAEDTIHFTFIDTGSNTINDWCVPIAGKDGSYMYFMSGDYIVPLALNYNDDIEAWKWYIGEWDSDGDREAAELIGADEDTMLLILKTSFKPVGQYAEMAPLSSNVKAFGLCNDGDGLYWGEFSLSLTSDSISYKISSGDAPTQGSPVFTEDGLLVGFVNVDEDCVLSTTGYFQRLSGSTVSGSSSSTTSGGSTAPEQPSDPQPVTTVAPEDPTAAPSNPTPDPVEPDDKNDNTKYYIAGGAAVVVIALVLFKKKKSGAQAKQDAQQPAQARVPFVKAVAPNQNNANKTFVTPAPNAAQPASNPNLKTIRLEPIGIRCTAGAHMGATYPISSRVSMGIDPSRCGIIYKNERGISRLHCTLEPTNDGRLLLTDEGSSYGTFVNGEKLTPHVPRVLKTGDKFTLADGRNCFVVFTEKH